MMVASLKCKKAIAATCIFHVILNPGHAHFSFSSTNIDSGVHGLKLKPSSKSAYVPGEHNDFLRGPPMPIKEKLEGEGRTTLSNTGTSAIDNDLQTKPMWMSKEQSPAKPLVGVDDHDK